MTDKTLRLLTSVALLLAFIVVVLGAYTRLSDAGLGCPDWPGCYGAVVVPGADSDIAQANKLYPQRPLQQDKAWKEMIHRYAAGTLGLLILSLAAVAWKRRSLPGQQVWIPVILLGLVIFQALLGMWTVTLLLKPLIVLAHLLGGMTILLLLFWAWLNQRASGHTAPGKTGAREMSPWAITGLVILYLQISLGGWTSANHAALVCGGFPVCQGQWWPPMDFTEGFTLWHGLTADYSGGVLSVAARTAIHMGHRIGALVTLLVIGAVAIRAMLDPQQVRKRTGVVLLLLLLTQAGLGIANVLLLLPLPLAVAHNAVAALLLLCMGVLLFYARSVID
ncbi:MAG: heme A synthase [Gammaproteobacteria bacterium]